MACLEGGLRRRLGRRRRPQAQPTHSLPRGNLRRRPGRRRRGRPGLTAVKPCVGPTTSTPTALRRRPGKARRGPLYADGPAYADGFWVKPEGTLARRLYADGGRRGRPTPTALGPTPTAAGRRRIASVL